MRRAWLGLIMVALAAPAAAGEGVEVLRVEKGTSTSVRILVRVANPNAKAVDALISCVGYRGGQPVHEDEAVVSNIPAGGNAIKNVGLFTPPPIERADCRVVRY